MIAYCAPGQKQAAEAVLLARGEQCDEVIEHPWLREFDGVIIVNPAALSELMPCEFTFSRLNLAEFDRIAREWNGWPPWLRMQTQ